MREQFLFQRTKPVPKGHCPEPVVEIHLGYHRPSDWVRATVWSREGEFRTPGAYGGTSPENMRIVEEYGGRIMDTATALLLPWSVAPLGGKYYGTHVLDCHGKEVMQFWDHSIPCHPSEREKAKFGEWTEEAWADYCCDSHWENERDYRRACAVVEAMNAHWQQLIMAP